MWKKLLFIFLCFFCSFSLLEGWKISKIFKLREEDRIPSSYIHKKFTTTLKTAGLGDETPERKLQEEPFLSFTFSIQYKVFQILLYNSSAHAISRDMDETRVKNGLGNHSCVTMHVIRSERNWKRTQSEDVVEESGWHNVTLGSRVL